MQSSPHINQIHVKIWTEWRVRNPSSSTRETGLCILPHSRENEEPDAKEDRNEGSMAPVITPRVCLKVLSATDVGLRHGGAGSAVTTVDPCTLSLPVRLTLFTNVQCGLRLLACVCMRGMICAH